MKDNGKRKYVDIQINNQTLRCLLDTGSEILIIDESTWGKISQQKLLNTVKVVWGESGNR